MNLFLPVKQFFLFVLFFDKVVSNVAACLGERGQQRP